MNLTEVVAIDNDVNRELEMGSEATIQVRKGSGSWTDIISGWFAEKVDQRPSGGKKFTRLSVADVDGAYSQILATMDSVKMNQREYKITDKDAPLGETREWIIELQPV